MKTVCQLSLALLLCCLEIPVSAEPIVIGESSTIRSEILGEERSLIVHLPAGYSGSQASYPVVYLLDAATNFHHTIGTIHSLSGADHIPQMIVIGLNNTDRTRDLTPTADSPDQESGEVRMPTAGGADNFLRFIIEELIPHVEETYRTAPFKILIGHSFGGLFVIHALVSSPDSFDAYIAISPSLQWDDGELAQRAKTTLGKLDELDKYLFMSIADEGGEMLAAVSDLAEFLVYNGPEGLASEFRKMEGDDHGSAPLRSTDLGLRMIYPRYRVPRSLFVQPKLAPLQQHFERLSAEYGFHIPVPEPMINRLGYMLMGRGDLVEAIEMFEFNVKNYPGSANVYDSLAEALERDGQYASAAENFNRAYGRGQQLDDPNTSIYKQHLDRVKAKIASEGTDEPPRKRGIRK